MENLSEKEIGLLERIADSLESIACSLTPLCSNISHRDSPDTPSRVSRSEVDSMYQDSKKLIATFSIDYMSLPVHARKILHAYHIETIGDVLQFSRHELLKMRGFGSVSLTELLRVLRSLDFNLPEKSSIRLQDWCEQHKSSL